MKKKTNVVNDAYSLFQKKNMYVIYLVRIESVDDQTHQLRNLSLERKGLGFGRHFNLVQSKERKEPLKKVLVYFYTIWRKEGNGISKSFYKSQNCFSQVPKGERILQNQSHILFVPIIGWLRLFYASLLNSKSFCVFKYSI